MCPTRTAVRILCRTGDSDAAVRPLLALIDLLARVALRAAKRKVCLCRYVRLRLSTWLVALVRLRGGEVASVV